MNRKNYTIYTSFIMLGLVMSMFLTACDKDEDPTPAKEEPTENEAIAKKWEVDNTASNGRVSVEAGDFLWFEFTIEGYFIILKTDMTTVTGTYSKSGDIITLDDYGILEITDLDDSNFSFTFTAKGETESVSIFTKVAEEVIAKSSKTELLCKTWSIKRQFGNFLGMEYDVTYPTETVRAMTVVFSAYGTYLVTIDNLDGSKEIMNRLWQWKDSEETMICYGDFSSECNEENGAEILELNEASFKVHSSNSLVEATDELVIFKK